MPSLHFGWTVLFAIMFYRRGKLPLRDWGMLYPTLTFFAITMTGNHYVLDAVAGGLLMLSSFLPSRHYGVTAAIFGHCSPYPPRSAINHPTDRALHSAWLTIGAIRLDPSPFPLSSPTMVPQTTLPKTPLPLFDSPQSLARIAFSSGLGVYAVVKNSPQDV